MCKEKGGEKSDLRPPVEGQVTPVVEFRRRNSGGGTPESGENGFQIFVLGVHDAKVTSFAIRSHNVLF